MIPKKAGLGFALGTILLDAIGVGLIFPIMPDLLLDLGIDTVSNATLYGGALITVYALMQFVFSPIVGNLSDRFGRRPVLLVAIAAMFVDYLIMGFATVFAVLFIGRVLAGIAGATVATASAYIADVSKADDKAKNFGLIGAAFGVGFILGPALGGFLGSYDLRLPFFFAAGLSLANFLFGYFFIPESLVVEKRRAFTWNRANPINAIGRALTHKGLRGIFWATFLLMVASYVYPVVWSFYGKEQFGWGLKTIGLTLAGYGVFLIVAHGFIVGPLVKWLGERHVIQLGNAVTIIGLIVLVVADQPWMVFALLPVLALGDISSPAIEGYMSNIVDETEQGDLRGIFASIEAMAAIVSPPIMSGLFFAFTSSDTLPYLPSAPFLMAAVFAAAAVLIFQFSLGSTSDQSD